MLSFNALSKYRLEEGACYLIGKENIQLTRLNEEFSYKNRNEMQLTGCLARELSL